MRPLHGRSWLKLHCKMASSWCTAFLARPHMANCRLPAADRSVRSARSIQWGSRRVRFVLFVSTPIPATASACSEREDKPRIWHRSNHEVSQANFRATRTVLRVEWNNAAWLIVVNLQIVQALVNFDHSPKKEVTICEQPTWPSSV